MTEISEIKQTTHPVTPPNELSEHTAGTSTNILHLQRTVTDYMQRTKASFVEPYPEVYKVKLAQEKQLTRAYLKLVQGISRSLDLPNATWIYGFIGVDSIVPLAIKNKVCGIDQRGNLVDRGNYPLSWQATGISYEDRRRSEPVYKALNRAIRNLEVYRASALDEEIYTRIREEHQGPIVFLCKGYSGRGNRDKDSEASLDLTESICSNFLQPGDAFIVLDDEDLRFVPVAQKAGFELLVNESHPEGIEEGNKSRSIYVPCCYGAYYLYFPRAVAVLTKGPTENPRFFPGLSGLAVPNSSVD